MFVALPLHPTDVEIGPKWGEDLPETLSTSVATPPETDPLQLLNALPRNQPSTVCCKDDFEMRGGQVL